MREHRAVGPRLWVPRVDVEHRGDPLLRFRVGLGRKVIIHGLQQRGHVPRIALQRGAEGGLRHLAVALGVGPGATGVEVGVVRQLLQTLLESACGEGVIVLLEGELAASKVDVAKPRVGLLGSGVNLFEDLLRIGAQQERRAAEDHEVGGRAVHPRAVAHGLAHLLETSLGFLRPAVGEGDVAAEPAQTQAAGVAPERLLQRRVGLGHPARGQQRADQQQRPLGVAGPLAQLGLGLADDLGVTAAEEPLPRPGQIGAAGPREERHQPERQTRPPEESRPGRGGEDGEVAHRGGIRGSDLGARRAPRPRVMGPATDFSSPTAQLSPARRPRQPSLDTARARARQSAA